MKVSFEAAFVLLALSNVEAFAVPPRTLWVGSVITRNYRANPIRRNLGVINLDSLVTTGGKHRREAQQQQGNGGGGLKIGGLTLGGPGGGINGNGLQLGGNQRANGQRQQSGEQSRNGTAAAGGKAQVTEGEKSPAVGNQKLPATEVEKPAANGCQVPPVPPKAGAGAGTENQPGRAEGEVAKQEALQEAQGEEGEKSNGVKATEESERFSEEIGITLDGAGNAQNLGGNLGITKGTDGSTSVGGENGINVAANGEATVAGNE